MRPSISSVKRLVAARPTPGGLTLAALAVCGLSGLPLLLFYRAGAPLESLARTMMLHPAGVWLRGVHFWSAQCALAGAAIYLLGRLLRRAEPRPPFAAWFRLVLAGSALLFALVSGFILRGDPAAERVADALRSLLLLVPPGGHLLALALFGSGAGLTVVFWHHVLTATVVLTWLLWARPRRFVVGIRAWVWALLLIVLLSGLWVPGLGADSRWAAAPPWYLAGGPLALRWLPAPGLMVGLVLSGALVLASLPLLAPPLRATAKWILLGAFLGYVALTGVGLKRSGPAANLISSRAYLPVPAAVRAVPIAAVAGRPEGCLSCHAKMTGFSPVHDPSAIGCTSCHAGNPFTLDARLAHAGLILTPGNLSVVGRTCATAGCHADIAARVTGTLMNTMSGVVAVDKVVFGESRDLNQFHNVATLDHSPADRHLRNLCASCHLGQEKDRPAAIDQQSRGGGCSTCHLDYGRDALAELQRRGADAPAPRHHPDISTRVPAAACFGCHSRSGRISTNYEGWHETTLSAAAARTARGWPDRFRVLEDGRVFTREPADVHFAQGMTCTDCHLASEIMGDGTAHAHEADAVKIRCTDCHATGTPASAGFTQLDPETQKLVALRQLNRAGRRFVRAGDGGVSYPNVFLDDAGGVAVVTGQGTVLRAKPPAGACTRDIAGHRKLECRTCHSAWAPQCISCHTSFDPSAEGWDHLAGRLVRGAWQEAGGDYRADPPVLGIERVSTAAGTTEERVATFVPGMVMTLSRANGATKSPDEFHRLYAPAAPHTIVTQARDCRSCHASPLALGYGRGTLKYEVQGGHGRWTFAPALPRSAVDGLPADAWIGFLEEPRPPDATRTNVRPFNRAEQERMLLVGACLQCHSETEPRVAAVFADFNGYRGHLSPRCVLPDWAN